MFFHHKLIDAIEPLHTGRTVPKGYVHTGRPQIRWFKDMGIGRKNQCRCHRFYPSPLPLWIDPQRSELCGQTLGALLFLLRPLVFLFRPLTFSLGALLLLFCPLTFSLRPLILLFCPLALLLGPLLF